MLWSWMLFTCLGIYNLPIPCIKVDFFDILAIRPCQRSQSITEWGLCQRSQSITEWGHCQWSQCITEWGLCHRSQSISTFVNPHNVKQNEAFVSGQWCLSGCLPCRLPRAASTAAPATAAVSSTSCCPPPPADRSLHLPPPGPLGRHRLSAPTAPLRRHALPSCSTGWRGGWRCWRRSRTPCGATTCCWGRRRRRWSDACKCWRARALLAAARRGVRAPSTPPSTSRSCSTPRPTACTTSRGSWTSGLRMWRTWRRW